MRPRTWFTALIGCLALAHCGGTVQKSAGGGGGEAGVGGTGALGGANAGGTNAGGAAGASSSTACVLTSQCIVRPRSCCGSCGAATRGDAISIRVDQQSAWYSAHCADTGCPECALPQDPTLVATCQAGTCAVMDLLELPLTACQVDQDCRLRTKSCCECGGATDANSIIAIRVDAAAEYARLVCDPGQSCDACVSPLPSGAHAACTGGRCAVVAHAGTTPQ